ncbi:MAG TPA: hypothetical protein VE972_09220 [Conexibacter sp.]|nr:hypothetical protein [Conexibacter sp.]
MRTSRSIGLLALAVASLVAFASGSAVALRALAINPGGPIRAEGPVRVNEALRVANIECELVLTGMLVRQVPKMTNAPLGSLTRLEFRNCIETFRRIPWIVTALVEPRMPAPVFYNTFLGTLPDITGILATAQNVGIRLTNAERTVECLFRGNLPYLIYRSPGELKFNRKMFLPNRLNYFEGRGCRPEAFVEIEGILILEPAQEVTLV